MSNKSSTTVTNFKLASNPAFSGLRAPLYIGCAVAVALIPWTESLAQEATATPASATTHLDDVLVTAPNPAEAVVQAAAQVLAEVPGSASVVNNADVERGRASNAEDVLSYVPGVFAQATSGNGANKISIRGSGLNTFYQGYALGTKFLYDGLPITGPGGTQEDLLDIAGVNYTEVLNGANAFSYASTSLGGAINFVTHTGYTSPGYYGRFEVGSFGYNKEQISAGGVWGNADYYVNVVRNERSGFQNNTPNRGYTIIGNFGYRFNDHLETRFIFRHRAEELVNGYTLTKAQIKSDPTLNSTPSGRKKDGTTLLASKTTFTFNDDSKLELGLGFNNYPLHNGWTYSTTPQDWTSQDVSATLRYQRDDNLFSKISSKTTAIFSDTVLVNGYVRGLNGKDGTAQTLRQYTKYSGSRDTVFALGNELELLKDRLWLTSGVSLIEIDRDVRIKETVLTNTTNYPTEVSYNKWYLAPRGGLRVKVADGVQLFGNVSQSVDAPVTWQMGSTGNGYVRPLKPQKAITAEVGVRGNWSIFEGSLTFYRSWIHDELLTVIITPATATADAVVANSNASPTIHQGIEAGLNARLWESQSGDKLILRQTYTLNDFFYENDAEFGGNELPSLPTHAYQGELFYQHPSGFYASFNVRAASGYYVDYANTVKADPYVILGAKIGYQTPKWEIFLDARNLTDKHYATAANTAYNLHGVDSANFYPGDGFGVTSGVSFRF